MSNIQAKNLCTVSLFNKRITCHGSRIAEKWNVSVSMRQLMLLVKCFAFNVKIKFTLEQATKDQRGSRGIALLYL